MPNMWRHMTRRICAQGAGRPRGPYSPYFLNKEIFNHGRASNMWRNVVLKVLKEVKITTSRGMLRAVHTHTFHSLIFQQFYDKLWLFWHGNHYLRLTNIICVIRGTIHTGSKDNLSLSIDFNAYFFRNKIPWRNPEVWRTLPTILCSNHRL